MQHEARFESGQRRRVLRVRAELRVVLAMRDGHKVPGRVMDLSMGGMHLEAERVPAYGEKITVIVQLGESEDWHLIPSTVRWFSRHGFGVAFEGLDESQARSLETFLHHAAVA